ncbi:DNA methyltransferase (plasmid) [Cupriavidus metallidurans]|uniref:DNA methyltransferase n=1 Tax=Cupriavidus metallidurans TaxID=119219 RepID=UPI003D746CDA
MESSTTQLDLFGHITAAYAEAPDGVLDNQRLYEVLADSGAIDAAALERRVPVGASGAMHSTEKRRLRWYQQTLRRAGVLKRVEGERGVWKLAEAASKDLCKAQATTKLVAFSTDLGVAIWSKAEGLFPALDEPIALVVTSTPYPLRRPRAYGNPTEADYVDFICRAVEPIVKNLIPGASVVLNIGLDIFEEGSPARSLYPERLTLALRDRLGLSLMDRIPWVNYSKPPGPTYWACVKRVQLSAAYEQVLWLTNDPMRVRSDNRRVLEPHTDRHMELMQSGGANRTAVYGDGAYRLRPNSFGKVTSGKIPRNVIERGHACSDTRAYRQHAKALGLPIHGAMQPTDIADFFIRLCTEPGELVVDLFAGTVKTGLAAERLGRRWLVTEMMLSYLRGAAEMFRGAPGFNLNPALECVGGMDG